LCLSKVAKSGFCRHWNGNQSHPSLIIAGSHLHLAKPCWNRSMEKQMTKPMACSPRAQGSLQTHTQPYHLQKHKGERGCKTIHKTYLLLMSSALVDLNLRASHTASLNKNRVLLPAFPQPSSKPLSMPTLLGGPGSRVPALFPRFFTASLEVSHPLGGHSWTFPPPICPPRSLDP
jgi:hypothetical protein